MLCSIQSSKPLSLCNLKDVSTLPSSRSNIGNSFVCLKSAFLNSSFHSSFLGSTFICTNVFKSNYLKKSNKALVLSPKAVLEVNAPALLQWFARMCVYYVLIKCGITGKKPDEESSSKELSLFGQLKKILVGSDGSDSKPVKSITSKWHANTKGALVRKTLVPSKAEGKRLLRDICSLLSEDNTFQDASTHKGCQIRRESAHGESVCCNNVRALFDELPTPRIMVEITVFPAGPITAAEYEKAAKLEQVLKKGNSI